MKQKITVAFAFLTGLGMLFIGARFMLAPEAATAGYGIDFNAHGDYSFAYIKGIRDLFSGLVICILALTRQIKALGIALAAGTIIPLTDMFIVLSKPYNGFSQAIPHISAVVICVLCGTVLLTRRTLFKPLT